MYLLAISIQIQKRLFKIKFLFSRKDTKVINHCQNNDILLIMIFVENAFAKASFNYNPCLLHPRLKGLFVFY